MVLLNGTELPGGLTSPVKAFKEMDEYKQEMDVLAKYNPGELRYTSVVFLPCLSSSLIMSLLRSHFHHHGSAATTPAQLSAAASIFPQNEQQNKGD